MASANEAGLIKVVVERAGVQKTAFQFRSDSAINAGKSPDGVLANLTTDKWMKVAKVPLGITAGDTIRLLFKFDAADGLDASDCVIQIPYYEDGVFKPLNAASFAFTTDIPAATPAGQWVELGTGYNVPANVRFAQLGGGDIVLSIEDDTA